MFSGFTQETSDFLWDLKFNNERTWFLENKERFETYVNRPFRALAAETEQLLKQRYPLFGGKMHISRIYRDARRLHGKGPYKENLWFSFEDPRAANAEASLFFEISAASYGYGIGFWTLRASQSEALRKRIDANPAAFERAALPIRESGLYRIEGTEYKKIQGTHSPAVNDWYNRRSPAAVAGDDFGGVLLTPELPEFIADRFDILMPMYEYLTEFTVSLNN